MLGELPAAQALLTESLSVLSQATGVAATDLNSTRQVLGLNYFRLGALHGARAAESGLPAAEQARRCAESRKWLALAEPIITASNADPTSQWLSISRYPLQVLGHKAGFCSSGTRPAS